MNLDRINTENRNNPINNPIRLTRRMTRCCSFCKIPGHNITSCSSDRLLEFEVICADIVKNMNTKIEFKNWLIENYSNDLLLIKAFTIRKSRVSTNDISIQYDLITEYIFSTYKNNYILEQQVEENKEEENEEEESQVINDNDIENDLLNLLLQMRNNYVVEHLQEELINQNIERMLQLEMAIAYLSNRYIIYNENNNINENNENNNTISRKNLINCTLNNQTKENMNKKSNCSICYDNKKLKNFVVYDCNHEFCENCIIKTLQINKNIIPCCALCRCEFKNLKTRTLKINAKIIESI
jgi:hypothetical protein